MMVWLQAAGAVQVAIMAGNGLLPGKLHCRENLNPVPPIIRQVFVVHWAYVGFVLAAFASICFWFPYELADSRGLGRFIAAFMAVFWLLRIPLQLFFYDRRVRREHRLADVSFLVAASYLGLVFTLAAVGRLR